MQQLWRTAESLPCSVLNLFLVVLGAAACFIAGAVKEKSADGQGNQHLVGVKPGVRISQMLDLQMLNRREDHRGDQVDLVIDGGIGGIEPSTIVDCTNEEAEIVRQGKGILNE